MALLASSVAVASMAVTVAACGVTDASTGVEASTGVGQSEPELGALPRIGSYDDVVFPLDSYHLSPEQKVTLARADDIQVRDCMRRYGFDFDLPDRAVEPELENRVIGLIDKDSAASFGYKPAGFAEHSSRVREAKSEQTKWSPEMMGVLNGEGPSKVNGVEVPEGGCDAEARQHLARNTDGKPGDENFVIRLEKMSGEATEADSRLKKAFAKWSDCMAEAGFNYRDPWQANGDPAFAEEKASAREVATATADVKCRSKHDVNGIWVAVRTAYQNRLIEANAEALRQHESAVAEQLRKAADVLAANR
ncbi:MAG: hypothetical protein GEV28_34770 [Actinophytocola sp.]|uniref:hypothetical protein n=1 Tax=Actinophytocola sp. TaxID=1872138 RepID=UPI00132A32EF|nr:hypothetical protein [Actinophytocola sp.]MPZ85275.1 hypothetical protein [Actinophytocola sp.]